MNHFIVIVCMLHSRILESQFTPVPKIRDTWFIAKSGHIAPTRARAVPSKIKKNRRKMEEDCVRRGAMKAGYATL